MKKRTKVNLDCVANNIRMKLTTFEEACLKGKLGTKAFNYIYRRIPDKFTIIKEETPLMEKKPSDKYIQERTEKKKSEEEASIKIVE